MEKWVFSVNLCETPKRLLSYRHPGVCGDRQDTPETLFGGISMTKLYPAPEG